MIRYNLKTLTPEKSVIERTIRGKGFEEKIKFINKKGTFFFREQCKSCKSSGRVQVGLGYAIDHSCDRDGSTWRSVSGCSDKLCKFYSEKEAVKDE